MSIISKLAEGDVAGVKRTAIEMARMYAAESGVILDDDKVSEVILLLMAGFAIDFAQELIRSKEMQNDDA